MDLWVVAAAAGAGYLAKFWQNISSDRDGLSELSSWDSNFEKPEAPSCPFRRLAQRKKLDKDVSTDRKKVLDERSSDMFRVDGDSAAKLASTSGFDGELGSLGNYEDFKVLSISGLPPGFSTNENVRENEDGNLLGASGDLLPDSSKGEMSSVKDFMISRSTIRTKCLNGHFVKPLNSLESCLMAQLYKERAEMEEYVLSSLPSPTTPTTRPLLVTDGSRIISRTRGDSFRVRIEIEENKLLKEAYSENGETVFGVPPLPKIRSLELPKKMKSKTGKVRTGRLSSSCKMVSGKHFTSQGSPDGSLLFCLGISVGIISSVIANKREVVKLKELLKQTENLVQDLQEELEMKDSLTMKELANENYDSQDTCDNSFHDREPNAFFSKHNMNHSTKYDVKEFYNQKAEESSESMSKIEAELEAELAMLGLNINTSCLQRNFPDLVELDPDFVADFAQGELRADMVNRQAVDRSDSNQDASGTSTTHSANYAVSPRELSLRLHEVIQSRLEERVKELEIALQNSQRKVHLAESEGKNSWRKFSNCELGSISTPEIPFAKECNSTSEPLVMNLSGEALDAYNEAYEELMKIDESEEDSPAGVCENNHLERLHAFDQMMIQGHNGGVNGSMPYLTIKTDQTPRELIYGNGKALEEHISGAQERNDIGMSGDEESDSNDEMEKLLIKQIVEKTKKGSPVVLNAQRVLLSMDDKEQYNETKESFAVYRGK